MEDGLGLATVALLLAVVAAPACNRATARSQTQVSPLHPAPLCEQHGTAISQQKHIPWATMEALPALYWVTLWGWCLRQALDLQ